MKYPVRIEQTNGEFTAKLLGWEEIRATHATRDGAIKALQQLVMRRVATGELSSVEFPDTGLLSQAGRFRDDPSLQEIVNEIYRERDRERDEVIKQYEAEEFAAADQDREHDQEHDELLKK